MTTLSFFHRSPSTTAVELKSLQLQEPFVPLSSTASILHRICFPAAASPLLRLFPSPQSSSLLARMSNASTRWHPPPAAASSGVKRSGLKLYNSLSDSLVDFTPEDPHRREETFTLSRFAHSFAGSKCTSAAPLCTTAPTWCASCPSPPPSQSHDSLFRAMPAPTCPSICCAGSWRITSATTYSW